MADRNMDFLAALVDSAQDAIVGVDLQGILTSWNCGAETLFGYSALEAIGSPVTLLVPPSCDDEAASVMGRVRRGERVAHFETVRRRKDGRLVDISLTASPVMDARGAIVGTSEIARDVSGRKQSEDAVRMAGERFRLLAETIPQKMCTATADGLIDYLNPQWVEYTGLPFEKIRQKGSTTFIHPDDVAENIRVWKHSVTTGEPFQFEHRLRRADGEYRWHMSRATALKDGRGKVLMWVSSNTDIHDVKESDRRKEEFLALLGHELRNPLAPISNALHVLARSGGKPEIDGPAIELLQRQFAQVVRLVDDLLDVSRISQGKIALRQERIDLASVIDHAAEACRVHVERMAQDLVIALPEEPLLVDADPVRLAQLVGNLLNNASKYTQRGGHIRLSAGREGAHATIRVEDNGVGIAAHQLPRIFEMFMQVRESVDRAQGGLGLGLSLVKQLVELHGGTVEAQSEGLGSGASFVVRLPLMDQQASP